MVENMKKNGFGDDPIVVVRIRGKYYVVDGHHRLAAAKRAGVNVDMKVVPPESVFRPGGFTSEQDIINSANSAGPDNLRGPGGKPW